ncbi:MAG TPA: hypothetical protein PKD64_05620 [Pirellulaceae bacterium]|nr:hypothetical protein [Pirellulaceae bacterium]HMO91657.1 hypothetical protein [Pirellulaceae bacterium]HMP68354.1 hypothetical protein [Pirellulaceae bacterium]
MTQSQPASIPQLSPLESYRIDLQAKLDQSRALAKKWRRGGTIRGLLFLTALGLFVLGFINYLGLFAIWLLAAGSAFAIFLVVAYLHNAIEEQVEKLQFQIEFAQQTIARLERNWNHLPKFEVPPWALDSATASDLDLFGSASLIQLISVAETPIGRQQLVDWMLRPDDVDQILARQQAVSEMATWSDHRDQIQLLGRSITTQYSDPAKFLAWSQRGDDNVAGSTLVQFARAITVFHVLLPILFAINLISLNAFVILLGSGLLINFLVTLILAGSIHDVFNQVAAKQRDARNYLSLFHVITQTNPQSEYLRSQHAELVIRGVSAQAAFSDLERRMFVANMRRSGLLYFVYLLLQFLFLWDVHALVYLRGWRQKFGEMVPKWFAVVARWEALASLARFKVDHPTWCFPEFDKLPNPHAVFRATKLGHPLLPDNVRVSNDVSIGPTGSILLVTGSNMSGKSTLLRSVGLNVVLAQMGSVVCAENLSMPCVELQTSMRIRDSLADGVSFYFAELKRLREIVLAARNRQADPNRVLLYLLDEILQGTNSRERQIAVSKVLEHLVLADAIGAISTHDLELATEKKLAATFRPVHFRETIANVNGERTMTFDYRMREGVATTTNALELLRLVGLDSQSQQ